MAPSRGIVDALGRILTRHQCQRRTPTTAPGSVRIDALAGVRSSFLTFSSSQRSFATTSRLASGHNRWSKIVHDKLKVDAKKNKQRSVYAHEIALASKLGGPELHLNTRLADLVTKAQREGFPKTSIEAAIARGQGRSVNGASLESVTVEGILPNNVAVIIESETDSRLRTLADIRYVLKGSGGSTTPSAYLFQKKGCITFETKEDLDLDAALESALELEALDAQQDEDGRLVVFTAPEDTVSTGESLAKSLGVEIASSQIMWEANEDTTIPLSSEEAVNELCSFVDKLYEREDAIQSVSMNVAQGQLSDESFGGLQARLS